MATLQSTNISDTGFIQVAAGNTGTRPAQPVTGMIRFNTDYSKVETYKDGKWVDIVNGIVIGAGETAATAANSAVEIKIANPEATDGVYWIDLPTVGATQVYCIMDSRYDGGGWMMTMKATRGNTFQFTSSYWTSTNTLNTGSLNQGDADAKFQTFNYFEGRDLLARFPDIGNGGSLSVGNWTWLQNGYSDFIGQSSSTLVNLFNTANRTFIGDAKQYSGYGSAWSSQVDVRFYGFNYFNNQGLGNGTRTRWGFGWNENGGGLFPNGNMDSDDVAGGIGMNGVQQNTGARYSAGDVIGCCEDSVGINRSARVEMYVR